MIESLKQRLSNIIISIYLDIFSLLEEITLPDPTVTLGGKIFDNTS